MSKQLNGRPRVLYRFVVNKPVHDVIRDLKLEGWPLLCEGNGKAVFSMGRRKDGGGGGGIDDRVRKAGEN